MIPLTKLKLHHLSTAAATLTMMDPHQPEPLIKLTNSIRQNSLQCHASVLIYSAAALNFVSQDFVTRNNFLGKCTRGPKIDVRIVNEQSIFTNKIFSPTNISID